MDRTFVAVAIAFGIVASVAAAHAQSDAIALVVRARSKSFERCFEVASLRQRIAYYGESRLARARELRLELQIDAPDRAELLVYRGPELVARRQFERLPDACSDRRDAVALAIALALDGVIRELEPEAESGGSSTSREAAGEVEPLPLPQPDRSAREARESPEPLPRPQETSRNAPVERVAAQEVAATDDEARPDVTESQHSEPARDNSPDSWGFEALAVELHAGGRVLAEALPSTVWMGALGIQLGFGPQFSVDLSGIASTIGNSQLAGARAETRLTGGELLGCSARELRRFEAQACVGAILAACRASGLQYPVEFPASTVLWAAGTARLAVRWPDDAVVSLRLLAQGHVNVVRPELRVQGSSDALYPFLLGGSTGVDVIVSLE